MIAIVKGNILEVMEAARLRGIQLVGIEKRAGGECLCRVENQHYDRVVTWYCEEPHVPPFPVGTCLYYAEGA